MCSHMQCHSNTHFRTSFNKSLRTKLYSGRLIWRSASCHSKMRHSVHSKPSNLLIHCYQIVCPNLSRQIFWRQIFKCRIRSVRHRMSKSLFCWSNLACMYCDMSCRLFWKPIDRKALCWKVSYHLLRSKQNRQQTMRPAMRFGLLCWRNDQAMHECQDLMLQPYLRRLQQETMRCCNQLFDKLLLWSFYKRLLTCMFKFILLWRRLHNFVRHFVFVNTWTILSEWLLRLSLHWLKICRFPRSKKM